MGISCVIAPDVLWPGTSIAEDFCWAIFVCIRVITAVSKINCICLWFTNFIYSIYSLVIGQEAFVCYLCRLAAWSSVRQPHLSARLK